jgi:hypothetical protein
VDGNADRGDVTVDADPLVILAELLDGHVVLLIADVR